MFRAFFGGGGFPLCLHNHFIGATNLTVENSHPTRPTSRVPSWLAPPATHRHSEVAPWRPEMGDSRQIVIHGMTSDPDKRPETNSVSLVVFSPKWPGNKWVHCLFNILKWSLTSVLSYNWWRWSHFCQILTEFLPHWWFFLSCPKLPQKKTYGIWICLRN